MTANEDRAKPMRYIGKSDALMRVKKMAEGILRLRKSSILDAVADGQFDHAMKLLDEDLTLTTGEGAIVLRWIRRERHYNSIRYTGLPL